MSTWKPTRPPSQLELIEEQDLRPAKADYTETMLARCREHLGRPRTSKPTRRIVCPACLIEIDIPDD
jgi:hypothetical protein